ncbi:MAG: formylglycine-generating enzyme family protein [bacterium]
MISEPISSTAAPATPPFPGMVWVPGGTFVMGSDRHYPEEAPAHRVTVSGFWMDVTPVTNEQFARFVRETGHVTFAEIAPRAEDYPGALPEMLKAGSLVFSRPKSPVDLRDFTQWWSFQFGADWRHPRGPKTDIKHKTKHPVVHVAYSDAVAYAKWAGKSVPTEAEWEFAAWGSRNEGNAEFAWGDELTPEGKYVANTWQGQFPHENLVNDGYEGTSPVASYPANEYGLADMIGNVWEWTEDWYVARHPDEKKKACCIPVNPRGPAASESYDPCQPEIAIPRKVLKGGSYLCAPNYCRRYRPAARHAEPIDTSTNHVGFRCIVRTATEETGS